LGQPWALCRQIAVFSAVLVDLDQGVGGHALNEISETKV
jgi:hypothetical protein